MKKERILLLGGNFYPEPTGIGKYNGEMIDWLSAHGFECSVITTFPYYPFWKVQHPYVNKSFWYSKESRTVVNGEPVKLYRCPHYIPKAPIGSKRVVSDISFFISAFLRLVVVLFHKKYDYVMTVAPPFQLGLLGLLYKKLRGAKLIYHIQDLQIDAAHELGMIKSKFLIRLMFGLEKFILRKTDYVSTISEGMISKIKGKYNRPVILFPNWVDTQAFHPLCKTEDIKKQFNFAITDKIILYSGAIGEKQGLETLLHSAKELNDKKHIKFIICGSGPYKGHLLSQAKELGLQNVIFMSLQSKEIFNKFLNMADVHLVLQKANVNDLVMPSKLSTILSVGGLALIAAEPQTNLHAVVAVNNIGIIVQPENRASLTASILTAVEQPCTEIRRNARAFAENNLMIDKVVSRYFSHITEASKKEVFVSKRNEPRKVDAMT